MVGTTTCRRDWLGENNRDTLLRFVSPDSHRKTYAVRCIAKTAKTAKTVENRAYCKPLSNLDPVRFINRVPDPLLGSFGRAPPVLFSQRNPNGTRIRLAGGYDEALLAMAIPKSRLLLFCSESWTWALDSMHAFNLRDGRKFRWGTKPSSPSTGSKRTLATIALPPLFHALGILHQPLRP